MTGEPATPSRSGEPQPPRDQRTTEPEPATATTQPPTTPQRVRLTKADVDALIEHVEGGGSVLGWCRERGVKSESSAYAAVQRHEAAKEFTRARMTGAARLADEALAIVDGADPSDPQDVARRKLRAETRLKLAACYAPAVYGLSKQAGAQVATQVNVTIATGVPGDATGQRVTVEAVQPMPLPDAGDDDAE